MKLTNLPVRKKITNYVKNFKDKFPKMVTHAEITVSDSTVSLNVVGIPSLILIYYSGSCRIENSISIGHKYKVSNRKVLINNPFGKKFPEDLFYFLGDFKIERCDILSFDGSKFIPDIVLLSEIENLNEKNLDVDKDDSIIQDDKLTKKRLTSFGRSKSNYGKYVVSENHILNKYGKAEIDEVVSIVTQALGVRLKGYKVSPKTVALEGLMIGDKSKPIVTKPTIARPTVSKPIKKEGGKY